MNDDDLKRLIAADVADDADGAALPDRLEVALAVDRQTRGLRRAIVAASLIGVALLVLSIGYWLAAMVLPPLSDGGLGALLWAPLVVPTVLVFVALRLALLALAEN